MNIGRILICSALSCSILTTFEAKSFIKKADLKEEQFYANADELVRRARVLQNSQPDSALTLVRNAILIYNSQNNIASEASARQLLASILTRTGDYAEAENILKSSGKFFESKNNSAAVKENYILLGVLCERSGKYDDAIEYYNRAINLAKEDSDYKNLGICYNNIGVIFETFGEYSRALENYYESLNYKTKNGDELGKASVYNNIGNIHKIRGSYDEALECYRKTLAARKQQKDEAGESVVLNNIGIIYKSKGDLETAASTFNEALNIAQKHWDKRLLARIYSNIAGVNIARRNYAEALRYYDKAIAIFEEQSDYASLASCYKVYGALQFEIRNPQIAITYLKKSVTVASVAGSHTVLKEALGSLATCYAATKQYDSAFLYQSKFSSILDSIASNSVVDNITKSQLKHDVEQRGEEIFSLKKNQEESGLALLAAQQKLEMLRNEHIKSQQIASAMEEQTVDNAVLLAAASAEAERRRIEAEHNHQQLQLLQKNEEISEAKLRNQQLWIWSGVSISVLLALITGLLVRANIISKKHGFELEEKNKRIVHKADVFEQNNLEITRQKEELAELATEISAKNIELQQKNEALSRANADHDQLLSIAMHDLKNSLSGIKMLSGILATAPEQLDVEEIKEFGASIKDNSEHLFHVIKGLSYINSIEQGKYAVDIEPVACYELLNNVVQKNIPPAEKKHSSIIFTPDINCDKVFALGDGKAIYYVLDELIANAIIFSPPESSVVIETQLIENNDTRSVKFKVIDQGPGFTQQDKEQLYSTFAKLSAQPTGGEFSTGLGLAIAKKLANASGGELELDSTSPNGSTFTLTYPVATEYSAASMTLEAA